MPYQYIPYGRRFLEAHVVHAVRGSEASCVPIRLARLNISCASRLLLWP